MKLSQANAFLPHGGLIGYNIVHCANVNYNTLDLVIFANSRISQFCYHSVIITLILKKNKKKF